MAPSCKTINENGDENHEGESPKLGPAPFLTKTFQLVDDLGTDDVISWGVEGTTFVVSRTAEFARDVLPKYFKHNNFSSFVRQLNTYGFRKIVPDKWEFANENFRRGEKSLLSGIHRKKSSNTNSHGKPPSSLTSGEDQASSSTSSADPAMASTRLSDLSGENEKLKRDNEILVSELVHMKKQCNNLFNFFSQVLNIPPEQIEEIMEGEGSKPLDDGLKMLLKDGVFDEKEEEEEEPSMKLFGVKVKVGGGKLGKKRLRGEEGGGGGEKAPPLKEMKMDVPMWMKISSS